MAALSNSKKYAILWLNSQGQSAENIAKELNVTLVQIQNIVQASSNTAAINSKNLMITHTAGKKANNVAIMTKEASESNDAKYKSMTNRTNDKGIFRPKPK